MKLFSIRDVKVEANLLPFCMRSRGEAIRAFGDACAKSSGDHPLAAHPEDFILFEIGSFDEQSGLIEAYNAPVSVCLGSDFKPAPVSHPVSEE